MAKATKKTDSKKSTQNTATDAAPVEPAGDTPQSLGEFFPGSATARSYDVAAATASGTTSEDGKSDLFPPDWDTRVNEAGFRAVMAHRRALTVKHRPSIAAWVVRVDQKGIDALQKALDETSYAFMKADPTRTVEDSHACAVDVVALSSVGGSINKNGHSRNGEKVLGYVSEHVAGKSWDDKRLQEEEGKRATLVGKVTDAEKALGLDAGTLLKGQADQIDSQVSDHMDEWETANPNPAELEAAAVELEAAKAPEPRPERLPGETLGALLRLGFPGFPSFLTTWIP